MEIKHIRFISILLLLGGCLGSALASPAVGSPPQKVPTNFVEDPQDIQVETWVEGLEAPWSLVFLSDNRALVSERPGRVRIIHHEELIDEPYLQIKAADIGESGLMGLAVHPEFPEQPFMYAMYTYREDGNLYNRIQRFRDLGRSAEPDRILLDRIPGSPYHDGGRLAFGPDGMLYASVGENFQAERAQDLGVLSGSILRIAPDGSIPKDNPFAGSPVWSYGHRNPQGLAWHPESGDLFSSEHGPSGEFGLNGRDEVNIIEKGKNYGWPRQVGAGGIPEYMDPLIMWVQATPPAGMTFWRGSLYLATLRSETLIRIGIKQQGDSYTVSSIEGLFASQRYDGTYGRLRDAVTGPDGALYVLTSNRDGRGTPKSGDDRIVRITPR